MTSPCSQESFTFCQHVSKYYNKCLPAWTEPYFFIKTTSLTIPSCSLQQQTEAMNPGTYIMISESLITVILHGCNITCLLPCEDMAQTYQIEQINMSKISLDLSLQKTQFHVIFLLSIYSIFYSSSHPPLIPHYEIIYSTLYHWLNRYFNTRKV